MTYIVGGHPADEIVAEVSRHSSFSALHVIACFLQAQPNRRNLFQQLRLLSVLQLHLPREPRNTPLQHSRAAATSEKEVAHQAALHP